MKLFCCYTPAHEVLLREHFLPSLPASLQPVAIPLRLDGDGDFLSQEFLDCIHRKIGLILETLEAREGELILWSDIDIVFRGHVEPVLRRLMQEGPYDMLFQREGFGGDIKDLVNTGFMLLRCNARVRGFFEAVRQRLKEQPGRNEQPIANELLHEHPQLKWRFLGPRFAARSHGWPPKDDLLLYHANVTGGADGVGQKQAQFAALQDHSPQARTKVCIVTPELQGPRGNSGIGTHCLELARFLAQQPDTGVDVLLTAPVTVEREGSWEAHFQQVEGITFHTLAGEPHLYEQIGWFNQWFNIRSQRVYGFLRRQAFDVCYFQDLNADGLLATQARRTGLAFAKTVFTTMLNGPNSWARQGMHEFVGNPVDEALLNFAESHVAEHSDLCLAPSTYVIDYVRQELGWKLPEAVLHCPYMLHLPTAEEPEPGAGAEATQASEPGVEDAAEPPSAPTEGESPYAEATGANGTPTPAEGPQAAPEPEPEPPQAATDPAEPALVFFGRLETRKGIHLFLPALEQLHAWGDPDVPRHVLFVGHHSRTPFGPSENAIPDWFAQKLPGWTFEIACDLDQPGALALLRRHTRSVIALPSTSETLGYTALECLALGLNVVATDIPAFREVFDGTERLVEPRPLPLAHGLRAAARGSLPAPRAQYDPMRARAAWGDTHQKTLELLEARKDALCGPLPQSPLVSVCIPYYNYPDYFPEQLQSLLRQTYRNLEILCIDDGSPDARARQVFDDLAAQHTSERCRFIRQENRGLCRTRNRAAELAQGDFLIFCDADNRSRANMVATFVEAILSSGSDCITCHFDKFETRADGTEVWLDSYTPLGACIEAGIFVDPYGDANCIVRKSVFEALGGFRHVPHTASEDWEFFAQLVLKGYTLEVVPLPLFEYRHHPASNMRQTNFYQTRRRTLQPFLDACPEAWQRRLLEQMLGFWETRPAPPPPPAPSPPEPHEAAHHTEPAEAPAATQPEAEPEAEQEQGAAVEEPAPPAAEEPEADHGPEAHAEGALKPEPVETLDAPPRRRSFWGRFRRA